MRFDLTLFLLMIAVITAFFALTFWLRRRTGKPPVLRYYLDLICFVVISFCFFGWLREARAAGTDSTLLNAIGIALFLAFLAVVLWRNIRLAGIELSFPTLFSVHTALAGFMLIIIVFADLYQLIDLTAPGSFAGTTATDSIFVSFIDFLYLSVVTFATVGFGDISPQIPVAKLAVILEICLFFFTIGAAGVTFAKQREELKTLPISAEQRTRLRAYIEGASYRDLKKLRRKFYAEGIRGFLPEEEPEEPTSH